MSSNCCILPHRTLEGCYIWRIEETITESRLPVSFCCISSGEKLPSEYVVINAVPRVWIRSVCLAGIVLKMVERLIYCYVINQGI